MDPASDLARRYQAGDASVAGDLLTALQPLINAAVHTATRWQRSAVGLETADLRQEAAALTLQLARRWDSSLGEIGAYIRTSLPGALQRWVQLQTPRRQQRTGQTAVLHLSPHDLATLTDQLTGDDGRRWDGDLNIAELLRTLPAGERRVIVAVILQGQSLTEVGRQLGHHKSTILRTLRRALAHLRAHLTP